jgi:Putative Ig domain
MATGTGVNVSKVNLYTVLTPPVGVSVSKVNLYAVLSTAAPPIWGSFTFANGVVGSAYSQSFAVASGSPPITYTVSSGSLPPGLSLSGNTISGTPTTAGTYSFTLDATNAFGSAFYPTSITVVNPTSGGVFVYAY